MKAFSDAAEFIDVDSELVAESVRWLLQYQDSEGCFQKRGYVHDSYIKGGGTDDSLTTFVLTALLQADQSKLELEIPEASLVSAYTCMMDRLDRSDLYSSILATHAASLFRQKFPGDDMEELVSSLTEQANTTAGGKFWQLQKQEVECSHCWWSYRPSSEAVEMTAYMVMTHVLRSELALALDSVKWLGRQRNSQGGFVSTQDTVVALQAISLYSLRVLRYPMNLNINVNSKGKRLKKLLLNEDNKLLLQVLDKEKKTACKLSITIFCNFLVAENSFAQATTKTNCCESFRFWMCSRSNRSQVNMAIRILSRWKNPHINKILT